MNVKHRASNTLRFVSDTATQYVETTLALPSSGATVDLKLGPQAVAEPGAYVLFDYSRATSATPLTGSASLLTVDGSDLVACSNPSLVHSVSERKIYVNTGAVASNGTQIIDGVLTINGPTTIYLNPSLYRAAGTYTLFSYGSLTGSISNLIIIPSAGRAVDTSISANGCAVVGSTITVKLI